MLLLYYEMEKYDERYSFYFQTKILPIPMAEAPIIIDSREHPINDMYVRITER